MFNHYFNILFFYRPAKQNERVSDPYVVVRVFGGRFAGAGRFPLDSIDHGDRFETASVARNGLRPQWNEQAVVLASHPELCIVHVEVRTAKAKRALGYDAVPLIALQAGHRVLALRDPDTGAQLHFAKLVLQVGKSRVPIPARLREPEPYWDAASGMSPSCGSSASLGHANSSFGPERSQMVSSRI